MPVVNLKSTLFRNGQVPGGSIDSVLKAARTSIAIGSMANAADDSTLSKYLLCEVPADGLPDLGTRFDVENWGFAAIRIGTFDDVDALVSVLKSAGPTVTPFAFGDANHGLRWWQVLGLATNPGGMIGLYAHAIANATGAGAMPFRVETLVN